MIVCVFIQNCVREREREREREEGCYGEEREGGIIIIVYHLNMYHSS